MQAKLRRHIERKHKAEPEVIAAQALSKTEKDRAFEMIKKRGIYKINQQMMRDGKNEYIREKQQTNTAEAELVMCGYCHGFFAKEYFHRHKRRCAAAEAGQVAVSVPLPVQDTEDDAEFTQNILSRFQQDDVGKTCQEDEMVLAVGKHLYHGKKPVAKIIMSKERDIRKAVMRDMRQLASLILEFKRKAESDGVTVTCHDLVNRKFYPYLAAAIQALSFRSQPEDDDSQEHLKAGTKLGLQHLIKTAAKVMKLKYLVEDNDNKAKDVDNFVTVFSMMSSFLFGDAQCKVVNDRQERLRKPVNLPAEEEVVKLRGYMMPEIIRLTSAPFLLWTAADFKELRNLLVSRLTLFNCRRGGEPSRLLISEWREAEEDRWLPADINQQLTDPADMAMIGKFKIAYQAGKGKKQLVSVLIPNDCMSGMQFLSSDEVRAHAGVASLNKFVFANTQLSLDHVSGWAATKEICDKAQLSHRLTATDMRHRVSTFYASLEVPQEERNLFYNHMGHSEYINQNVYQCPMAAATIMKVGRQLERLDTHGNTFI